MILNVSLGGPNDCGRCITGRGRWWCPSCRYRHDELRADPPHWHLLRGAHATRPTGRGHAIRSPGRARALCREPLARAPHDLVADPQIGDEAKVPSRSSPAPTPARSSRASASGGHTSSPSWRATQAARSGAADPPHTPAIRATLEVGVGYECALLEAIDRFLGCSPSQTASTAVPS